ncbi:uncharacterized protein LOC107304147 [Oryza brachyantha]|uniref:Uncharacterized protein n=1 Tax=Oryza brachyantha TaxID=4533 RepID=J3LZD3_ORYBR|nr:uncharacterized protein LOC107304147 [Oryza brachyantha]
MKPSHRLISPTALQQTPPWTDQGEVTAGLSRSRLAGGDLRNFWLATLLIDPLARSPSGSRPRLVMDNLAGSTKRIPPMQTPRARLLLSCGESVVAMGRKAYQRVEAMPCPVGCVARGVSRAAAPVLSPLRLRWFSALAFVDRQLLVVQDVATVLFPATERVLGKADGLVLLVESLPARLDGAIDGLEALVAGVKSGAGGLFVLPKRRYRYRADEDDEEEGASLHRSMEKTARKNSDDVARKKLESLELFTADSGAGGGSDTVHGEKAISNVEDEGKGESATPAKHGDASGGQECTEEDAIQGGAEIAKAEPPQAASDEEGGRGREIEAAAAMAGTESREDALLGLFDTAWQQKLA